MHNTILEHTCRRWAVCYKGVVIKHTLLKSFSRATNVTVGLGSSFGRTARYASRKQFDFISSICVLNNDSLSYFDTRCKCVDGEGLGWIGYEANFVVVMKRPSLHAGRNKMSYTRIGHGVTSHWVRIRLTMNLKEEKTDDNEHDHATKMGTGKLLEQYCLRIELKGLPI